MGQKVVRGFVKRVSKGMCIESAKGCEREGVCESEFERESVLSICCIGVGVIYRDRPRGVTCSGRTFESDERVDA